MERRRHLLYGSISLALIALLLGSVPAQAQISQHSGAWIGFGLGAGSGQIDCSRCGPLAPDDPWKGGMGPSGYFVVGGTLRPRLLFGGEVNVWARRSRAQQRDATLALGSLIGQYYPVATSSLYLRAGLGLGASIFAGGGGLIEGTGGGVRAGAGFDVYLGERFALSPFASYAQLFSQGGRGENQGEPAAGPSRPGYVQFGVGFTWY